MATDESMLSRRAALGLVGKLAGVAAGAAVLARAPRAFARGGGDRGGRRDPEIETRFSREFGLRLPLANAGMAFVALPDLAAAVSNAGAMGVYGVGIEPPPVVEARLAELAELTSAPFGVDLIVGTAPSGPITTQAHIDVIAAAKVAMVMFHWDVPDQSWVHELHASGAKVFVQTGDVALAQRAVAVGVDGIIAQGKSAAGHNKNSTTSTLRTVSNMRRALPDRIIILASGGVADGKALIRAIRAGADGAWAGTVFVAAEESYANDGYKAKLIAAKNPDETGFTTVFGPEWPDQQQRTLVNEGTKHPDATVPATIGTTTMFPGVLDVPYTMPLHSAIVPTRDTIGDLDQMDMPAGSVSIKYVKRVRPAADIVDDFVEGCRDWCDRDFPLDLDQD